MNLLLPKQPGVRLDAKQYTELRREVLRRDGWRCQGCGSRSNLEVHHQEFRSHSGDDSAQNLITVCALCHEQLHRGRENRMRPAVE